MCDTFSTFGYVNAWGVFQAYYEETLLKDSSPSNMRVMFHHCHSNCWHDILCRAWIGSIQVRCWNINRTPQNWRLSESLVRSGVHSRCANRSDVWPRVLQVAFLYRQLLAGRSYFLSRAVHRILAFSFMSRICSWSEKTTNLFCTLAYKAI